MGLGGEVEGFGGSCMLSQKYPRHKSPSAVRIYAAVVHHKPAVPRNGQSLFFSLHSEQRHFIFRVRISSLCRAFVSFFYFANKCKCIYACNMPIAQRKQQNQIPTAARKSITLAVLKVPAARLCAELPPISPSQVNTPQCG